MTWLDCALGVVLVALVYVVFVRQWAHTTCTWCGGQNTGTCRRCRREALAARRVVAESRRRLPAGDQRVASAQSRLSESNR